MGRVSPISLVARRKTDLDIDIAKASVAAGRILDMRGKDRVDGDLVSLDIGNIGDNDMGVKIQFQNVWFRYPTRDVPILNGINLTVSIPVVHCKRH
jgi:ABC-type multidrug transport system fused ATPase/permease subunit